MNIKKIIIAVCVALLLSFALLSCEDGYVSESEGGQSTDTNEEQGSANKSADTVDTPEAGETSAPDRD